VFNTKAQAHRVYTACKEHGVPVYHLSTAMCPRHRTETLGAVRRHLDAGEAVICVSTQLIEAGVDVDFHSVIRSLTGLDSIAQAAGRCNRNGRRALGRVLVVNPSNERLGSLRDIRLARDVTKRVLDEFRVDPEAFDGDIIGMKALERFYEYYFFDRRSEMGYPVDPGEVGGSTTLIELLSVNGPALEEYMLTTREAPAIPLRQAFKSAAQAFKVIDAPTSAVIVPFGDEGAQIVTQLQEARHPHEIGPLLKRAQVYSVNLFPHALDSLRRAGAVYETREGSDIYYLNAQYYSGEVGVCDEPATRNGAIIVG
jgi:CRISPR-associated endonuclease/helicase Cas3